MNRTATNFYRSERKQLAERRTDVDRETIEVRARIVELEREHALLDQLIGALDSHVPETESESTTVTPIRRGDVSTA